MAWFSDRQINKGILCGMLFLFIMAAGGCGKAGKDVDAASDSQENDTKTVMVTKTPDAQKAESPKGSAGDEEGKSVQNAAENEEMKNTEGKVPVYTLDDKKKIKKYLASYPSKWEKIKKADDIIFIGHDGAMTKKGLALWEEFLAVQTGAVIIVQPTVEGDFIYQYVSKTEEGYTQFCDMSRDNYGGGYSFDSYTQLYKEESKKEKSISYYLFVAADGRELTDKEMKGILKRIEKSDGSENGDDRAYWLFSYRTCR